MSLYRPRTQLRLQSAVASRLPLPVLPRHTRFPALHLEPDRLELPEETRQELTEYLDERRLLTSRLNVRAPAYRWVAVKVQLRAEPGIERAAVEREVLQVLYRFLNPLVGGPTKDGWPFGRDLFVSDVYQSLQQVRYVQFIRSVEMRTARPGGAGVGEPVESIEVVAHGVIASGLHEVEFV